MDGDKTKNQMNLVLFPLSSQNFLKTKTKNGNWFFIFDSNEKETNAFSISSIENYFNNFQDISLNSRIYAMTSSKVIFEVYRKMPNMGLTISLLCNMTDKFAYLNKKELWMRRKDLSGTHFKIGYFPDWSFCFEINKVSFFTPNIADTFEFLTYFAKLNSW